MTVVACILIFLGWPTTSLVVYGLRHSKKNMEPGVSTQHIVIGGVIVQVIFIGSGFILILI